MPNLPEFAWRWILHAEGGDSDHPADRGGRTKYGISQSAFPECDIADITAEQARHIYARDYWHKNRCDELPKWAAMMLFDAMVNHRPDPAKRIFQYAVGVRQDGIVGPITRAAASTIMPDLAMDRYFARRALHYHDIAVADSSQSVFLLGWFARLFRLRMYLAKGHAR